MFVQAPLLPSLDLYFDPIRLCDGEVYVRKHRSDLSKATSGKGSASCNGLQL